jgi:hypothetical protein
MKILIIILSIIGLLKLVSLFILCIIEIYYRIVRISIDGVRRDHGIYKDLEWYLIPAIYFTKSSKYLEVSVCFLCFKYYCAYSINKDDKE